LYVISEIIKDLYL